MEITLYMDSWSRAILTWQAIRPSYNAFVEIWWFNSLKARSHDAIGSNNL